VTEAAPRRRRTQDERSSAMRERLLDATIECLVEYGYTGTTVTRIADRAGVTRGAQVHHFRTKDDLVTAAVKHLAGRSAEFGWAQVAVVAASAPRVPRNPVAAVTDRVSRAAPVTRNARCPRLARLMTHPVRAGDASASGGAE